LDRLIYKLRDTFLDFIINNVQQIEAKNKVRSQKKKRSADTSLKSIHQKKIISIVIEGLRGESSTAELCWKEGIHTILYYNWSKDFLEAGKKRLTGDFKHEVTSSSL